MNWDHTFTTCANCHWHVYLPPSRPVCEDCMQEIMEETNEQSDLTEFEDAEFDN